MTLGNHYIGIDLRSGIDANGVKVKWWCIWYPKRGPWNPTKPANWHLGYLYGSVRNQLPEPVSMPDPVVLDPYDYDLDDFHQDMMTGNY